MNRALQRKLIAEAFGTFALVFAGTGAIAVNEISHGTVTHVGIALTFGLIVLSMIYAIGDVSGCHLNPAVTLAFYAARCFEGHFVAPYCAAQIVGALVASTVIQWVFPTCVSLGSTRPSGGIFQSFVLEFILTLILMFVILSVSTGSKEKGLLAGVAVGSVVALEALFAGPISGASMNPVRSLGPAVVSWNFEYLWIYLVAPVAGAMTGVAICRFVHDTGEQESHSEGLRNVAE